MKKSMTMMLLAFLIAGPMMAPRAVAQGDTGAATLLSLVLPGVGEWYNSGWRGSYPWGECIVGSICFLFRYSSTLDAANGNSDNGMRLDFWSAPQ